MSKEINKESSSPFPFDPERDIRPVDQFGFVDLREAYVDGSVPGDLSSSEDNYNGVEDPSSLIGKSSDVFDALRKAAYVKSVESAAKAAAATAGAGAASPAVND